MRLILTSGDGAPLYMAPGMYDTDYTCAIDVYSFALDLYDMFAGQPPFPAATMLPVLFRKVSRGGRPPLPGSTEATIQQIMRRGWSVGPAARGSFEDILEALQRIRFKMTPVVDLGTVAEFVALVNPSAAVRQFPPLMKKRKATDRESKDVEINAPGGTIAHLTRKCGGNVHDCDVIDVTSGPFEKETEGADSDAQNAASWHSLLERQAKDGLR
jgi:serine/threonine protein kinase